MLPRADVRDRLIGADNLHALPEGARLGTSSPRRKAQLLARRPDFRIVPLRGNVETRLRKIELGEADATLLASAGLERLGKCEVGVVLDDFLPAPSQGAVGIEVRADNRRVRALIGDIDHRPTHACVAAERRLLEGLGGTCHSPVAALAQIEDGEVRLRAEIMAEDGSSVEAGETCFALDDRDAPLAFARELLARAAPRVRLLFGG
jgi:hydroxymethylbilane synthase